MRALLIVSLLSLGVSCTPYIPVRDDFATSALAPAGDIPPEFAEFNVYNPRVNQLLADQLCATPYQPIEQKALGADSGRLVQGRARCATHVPFFGNEPWFAWW
jgi:hypothetical protein